jgi:hypothetical protein
LLAPWHQLPARAISDLLILELIPGAPYYREPTEQDCLTKAELEGVQQFVVVRAGG